MTTRPNDSLPYEAVNSPDLYGYVNAAVEKNLDILHASTGPLQFTDDQARMLAARGVISAHPAEAPTIPAIHPPKEPDATLVELARPPQQISRRGFMRRALGAAAACYFLGKIPGDRQVQEVHNRAPAPNPNIVSRETISTQVAEIRHLLLNTDGARVDRSADGNRVLWAIFKVEDGTPEGMTLTLRAKNVDTDEPPRDNIEIGVGWFTTANQGVITPDSGSIEYQHNGYAPDIKKRGYYMQGSRTHKAETAAADAKTLSEGGEVGWGYIDDSSTDINEKDARQVNAWLNAARFNAEATQRYADREIAHFRSENWSLTSTVENTETKTSLFGTTLADWPWQDVKVYAPQQPSSSQLPIRQR